MKQKTGDDHLGVGPTKSTEDIKRLFSKCRPLFQNELHAEKK